MVVEPVRLLLLRLLRGSDHEPRPGSLLPSTIYAGIDADFDYPGFNELFKSTDGGATWKASDAGLQLWSSVRAVAVHPGDPARTFASTSVGTYLSLDSGRSWFPKSGSASRAFAIDPRNPAVVYAGTTMRECCGARIAGRTGVPGMSIFQTFRSSPWRFTGAAVSCLRERGAASSAARSPNRGISLSTCSGVSMERRDS